MLDRGCSEARHFCAGAFACIAALIRTCAPVHRSFNACEILHSNTIALNFASPFARFAPWIQDAQVSRDAELDFSRAVSVF